LLSQSVDRSVLLLAVEKMSTETRNIQRTRSNPLLHQFPKSVGREIPVGHSLLERHHPRLDYRYSFHRPSILLNMGERIELD
jgi:hypothetical protein